MRSLLLSVTLVLLLAGCGRGTPLPEDYPAPKASSPTAPTASAEPRPATAEAQPAVSAAAAPAPAATPKAASTEEAMPPNREGLLRASFSRMRELADVLRKVKDTASAKAAVPEVDRLTNAMQTINRTYELMPKLSDAEEEALAAKVRPEYQAAVKELTGEMKRIRKDQPAAMEILQPLMKKLRRSNAPAAGPKPPTP